MHNQETSMRMQQENESVVSRRRKHKAIRSASRFAFLPLLFCSLLVAGLSARGQDSPKYQDEIAKNKSGFLGDNYSKLQPDPKNDNLLVYWGNENALKSSNKFELVPVVVYLLPEAQQRGIDPEQLSKLAQYFTKSVKDELSKSGTYQIVTAPGPSVLVLRLAITNLEPNGGMQNAAVKGAATAASTAVAPGASMVVPRISVGKVSIEGELVDSVSGNVIVAFMSSRQGRRYFSGLKAYQKWGDVEAAFRAWAKNFRLRLDAAHES
jgi:hypothetical protein